MVVRSRALSILLEGALESGDEEMIRKTDENWQDNKILELTQGATGVEVLEMREATRLTLLLQ